MDEFDVLYHDRFPYINLSEEEGDFYVSIIRHSKELCDTNRSIRNDNPCDFSLIQLKLKKNDDIIFFDGIISNDVENRGIRGEIKKILNKVYLEMNVVLFDMRYEEYNCIEKFKFSDNKIIRTTSYEDKPLFEGILEPFNEEEITSFKESIVDGYEIKK